MTAPGIVGDYALRYVHGHSRKVIGRADLKATLVEVGVTVPATAQVAVDLDVTWQGPDYPGDYIAIVRPGQGADQRINYTYTKKGCRCRCAPLQIPLPMM